MRVSSPILCVCVCVCVHRVATVSPSELIDYVKGNSKNFPQKVVQALDIVLDHVCDGWWRMCVVVYVMCCDVCDVL